MNNNSLVSRSLLSAVSAAVYVIAISFLIYFGQEWVGHEDNVFMPIAMLLLLVLSVAVMGYLIFARPAMMYVDGQKPEALRLLGYTLGWLGAITVIALVIMTIVSRR